MLRDGVRDSSSFPVIWWVSGGDKAAGGCHRWQMNVEPPRSALCAPLLFHGGLVGAAQVSSQRTCSPEHTFGAVLFHCYKMQPIHGSDSRNESQRVVTPIRLILRAMFGGGGYFVLNPSFPALAGKPWRCSTSRWCFSAAAGGDGVGK